MDAILRSFAYCLDYLREQVADVLVADMVAQPNGIVNHPAWVIGHLTASCQAVGREIGMQPWLPKTWGNRFGMGSIPLSDVSAYESKTELLEILRDAQTRITDAIENLEPTQLEQPLPEEKYRPVLPTVRHALAQMLVAHTANHIGQVTIWRRMMGLPPLDRPFL
jgi:hypothetical protein